MPKNSQIYLATDHAGFSHKESVKEWLLAEGYSVTDCGAYTYDSEDDFPVFIKQAAEAVAAGKGVSILFGGSGQGEAMVANRFKGVRATVYYGGSDEIVALSRQHNDANVLSIGARFVSVDDTKRVIWQWLHTDSLPEEKYKRRNQQLDT